MSRPHISQVQETIQLRKEHPDWSLEKIGKELGITRISVWETLKRYNIPTQSIREPRLCPVCFKPARSFSRYCSYVCMRKRVSVNVTCKYCGKIVFWSPYKFKKDFLHGRKKSFYCNMEHYKLHLMFTPHKGL
jgi:hypothetical protein